ncbi:isoprenylcysteine carboxylmethyltransferase family protein [Myxococcota bacterium]|nr:isoprenylcysteine carboxylmethyltransferase family protein [Myxococcota bacterium]
MLPLPGVAAQLLWAPPSGPWAPGLITLGLGALLRFWAVGVISARSRTRSDETWEVARTGPYRRCRNPLYVGNLLMWVGLGALSGPWIALLWALAIAVEVSFIVRWEEANLLRQRGAAYAAYLAEVPRWGVPWPIPPLGPWSFAEALRGERSTWLVAAACLGLMALRQRVGG